MRKCEVGYKWKECNMKLACPVLPSLHHMLIHLDQVEAVLFYKDMYVARC